MPRHKTHAPGRRWSSYSLEIDVSDQGLKLGTPRDSHVQGFGCEECLQIKQVEVVSIHQVSQQLIGQTIQGGHHRQSELPPPVCGSIHKSVGKVNEWQINKQTNRQ